VCKTLLIIYNIVDTNTPTEDNQNQNKVKLSRYRPGHALGVPAG
jgi:hypothetical protein